MAYSTDIKSGVVFASGVEYANSDTHVLWKKGLSALFLSLLLHELGEHKAAGSAHVLERVTPSRNHLLSELVSLLLRQGGLLLPAQHTFVASGLLSIFCHFSLIFFFLHQNNFDEITKHSADVSVTIPINQ